MSIYLSAIFNSRTARQILMRFGMDDIQLQVTVKLHILMSHSWEYRHIHVSNSATMVIDLRQVRGACCSMSFGFLGNGGKEH